MSALVVEHVRHEGPYRIGEALAAAGVAVERCPVWAGAAVPGEAAGYDALVVMGGPMSALGDAGFPTRRAELALLREALAAGVPVLGVCLGAQLLAAAAGGAARPGWGAQIGWGEVATTAAAAGDPLLAGLPAGLPVLHWHGDTMRPPAGAVLLASCDRYPVQAFRVGAAAWGLQFHLEVDAAAVEGFAAASPEEAAGAPDLLRRAPAELAAMAPHGQAVFARFAALAAARATGA